MYQINQNVKIIYNKIKMIVLKMNPKSVKQMNRALKKMILIKKTLKKEIYNKTTLQKIVNNQLILYPP